MNYRSREVDPRLALGLRVLCLHDANSNATKLSNQLEELGERLYEKHAIDLVYINSPLTNGATNSETEEPDRIWWEDTDDGKFVGLDASLLLLRQVWNSMPFWGVLAVGQGAAAASFLPLLPVDPMPAFGIFVHGESILEEEERLIEQFPCLHVVGANPEPSQKLIKQFGGEVHQGGKNFNKATVNAIGKVGFPARHISFSKRVHFYLLTLQHLLYPSTVSCITEERITSGWWWNCSSITKPALPSGTRSSRCSSSADCCRPSQGSHGSDFSTKRWRMAWC
jgi:hypothetical protein